MSAVDVLVLAAVGFALASGFRRGLALEAFTWGGVVAGVAAGQALAPSVVDAFGPKNPAGRAAAAVLAFLVIFALVSAAAARGGWAIGRRMRPSIQRADRIAGSLLAGLLSLVAVWLIGGMLMAGPSPEIARAVRQSAMIRALDDTLPARPASLAEIERFLDRRGFPRVFTELNPSLAPPVAPAPSTIIRSPGVVAASAGVVRVVSLGCGGEVEGSGFAVDSTHILTAAHVVAGTRSTRVVGSTSPSGTSGFVVYLDPRTDIAVIRLERVPGPVLTLGRAPAPRGSDGAVVGYPGGGSRTVVPARVRSRGKAVGRDIYAREPVSRDIYVLNARVRQGDSGGPLLDGEGHVLGLVFAASLAAPDEGYALTAREILQAQRRSSQAATPVDRGECA
jgi:S1-C subfamily serine protease